MRFSAAIEADPSHRAGANHPDQSLAAAVQPISGTVAESIETITDICKLPSNIRMELFAQSGVQD